MAALISNILLELDKSCGVLRLPQFSAPITCYPSTIPSETSDSPHSILVAVDGRFTKDYPAKTQVVLSGELSAGQDGNSLVVFADELGSPDQYPEDPAVLVVATVSSKDTTLNRYLTLKTRNGTPNALTLAIPATGLIGKDYQAVRVGYIAVVKGTISSLRHSSSGEMLAVLAPTRYYRFFPAFPTPGVSTIMHDFPRPNLAFGKASRQLYGTTRPTLLVRSQSVCGLRGRPTLNSESAQDTDSTCSDDDYPPPFEYNIVPSRPKSAPPVLPNQHDDDGNSGRASSPDTVSTTEDEVAVRRASLTSSECCGCPHVIDSKGQLAFPSMCTDCARYIV